MIAGQEVEINSSAVEIENAVNVFHRAAALDQTEPQAARLEILSTFAKANTAAGEEAVEVRVELEPVRLQHTAIDHSSDVAFGNEELTPGVVGLAVSPQA